MKYKSELPYEYKKHQHIFEKIFLKIDRMQIMFRYSNSFYPVETNGAFFWSNSVVYTELERLYGVVSSPQTRTDVYFGQLVWTT